MLTLIHLCFQVKMISDKNFFVSVSTFRLMMRQKKVLIDEKLLIWNWWFLKTCWWVMLMITKKVISKSDHCGMKDRLLEGSRILKSDQRSYIIGFPFHNFQNEELRFSTVFSLIMLFFVFHKKSSDWTISIFFRKTFLFKMFIRKRRNADFMVRIISMA